MSESDDSDSEIHVAETSASEDEAGGGSSAQKGSESARKRENEAAAERKDSQKRPKSDAYPSVTQALQLPNDLSAGSIADTIVKNYGQTNNESSTKRYEQVVQQTFASLEAWIKANKNMTSASIKTPRQIKQFVQIILDEGEKNKLLDTSLQDLLKEFQSQLDSAYPSQLPQGSEPVNLPASDSGASLAQTDAYPAVTNALGLTDDNTADTLASKIVTEYVERDDSTLTPTNWMLIVLNIFAQLNTWLEQGGGSQSFHTFNPDEFLGEIRTFADITAESYPDLIKLVAKMASAIRNYQSDNAQDNDLELFRVRGGQAIPEEEGFEDNLKDVAKGGDKLKLVDDQVETLTKELEQSTTKNEQLQSDLQQRKIENTSLQQQIAESKANNARFESDLQQSQDENVQLQQEIVDLRSSLPSSQNTDLLKKAVGQLFEARGKTSFMQIIILLNKCGVLKQRNPAKTERTELYRRTNAFDTYCSNYTRQFFSKSTCKQYPQLTLFTIRVSAACCVDEIISSPSYKASVKYFAKKNKNISSLTVSNDTPYEKLVNKITNVLLKEARNDVQSNILGLSSSVSNEMLLKAFNDYLQDENDNEFCSNLKPLVARAQATAAPAASSGPLDLGNTFRIKLRFV